MTDIPHETELKLALAPGESARVAHAAPLAGLQPRRARVLAYYFDTPGRELAHHGLGLRLRRVGRHWRATLKAAGTLEHGLHHRPEWEYPAPGAVLDLARFANTPLAAVPGAETLHARLAPVLACDFRRTLWRIDNGLGSRLEVALDEGRLLARGRAIPVEELEIEVLDGPVTAAFDLAETLAATLSLRPEPATKLARGLALARPARPRPVRAAPVELQETKDPREATRTIVRACLAQAQANEAGVLASTDIEFVHQQRVALRRLRSALRLFRQALQPEETAAFADELRWAAIALGRCRDWDVFVSETLPPLCAAEGDAAHGRAILRRARAHQRDARRSAREAILSPRYGLAMIRVLRWVSMPVEPRAEETELKDFASARLRKGARGVSAQAAAFGTLDAAGRHRLRILVKRQRYAVEFLGSLFRGAAVKRHVRALAAAQDALGLANDCANALAHVRELGPPHAFVEFARGWFAAREAAGIEAAAAALADAAAQRRFWRRKPRMPEPVPAA